MKFLEIYGIELLLKHSHCDNDQLKYKNLSANQIFVHSNQLAGVASVNASQGAEKRVFVIPKTRKLVRERILFKAAAKFSFFFFCVGWRMFMSNVYLCLPSCHQPGRINIVNMQMNPSLVAIV